MLDTQFFFQLRLSSEIFWFKVCESGNFGTFFIFLDFLGFWDLGGDFGDFGRFLGDFSTHLIEIIMKIIKRIRFCLVTLNARNFATTGSCAVKFLPVSDLGQNFRIPSSHYSNVLLLFEFLEFVVERISRIFQVFYVFFSHFSHI